MKQIINWTAGGFFRTLGRILVYIVLGFVISLFVANSGIKLPSWLIMKVDAATTITPSSWGSKVQYTKTILGDPNITTTETSNWLTGDYINFCGNNSECFLLKNWYYVKLNTSLETGRTYTMNFSTYNTNRGSQTYYNRSSYSIIASNTGQYNGSSSSNISGLSCRAGIAEGTTSRVDWSCSFTPTTAINYIYLTIIFDTGNPLFSSYSVNRASLTYDNSQVDAINNQTNIIIDQTTIINDTLNDLNDTLSDDNVSDSVNTASDYIVNFDIPEHNNLVTIATLPLQLISNLVNDNYTDLCFTLNNTQACIPSGRIIWNRSECSTDAPFGCGSVSAVKTFFNLVVGGFLSWKLLKGIYNEIHTALDPTADAVSWGVKKL